MEIKKFSIDILKREKKQTSYFVLALALSYALIFNVLNLVTSDLIVNSVSESAKIEAFVTGGIMLFVSAIALFLGYYINNISAARRKREVAIQLISGIPSRVVVLGLVWQVLCMTIIATIIGLPTGIIISPIFNKIAFIIMGTNGAIFSVSLQAVIITLVLIIMQMVYMMLNNSGMCYKDEIVDIVKNQNESYKPKKKSGIVTVVFLIVLWAISTGYILYSIFAGGDKVDLMLISKAGSMSVGWLILIVILVVPAFLDKLAKKNFSNDKVKLIAIRNLKQSVESSLVIIVTYFVIVFLYINIFSISIDSKNIIAIGIIGLGLLIVLQGIALCFKVVAEANRRESAFKQLNLLGYTIEDIVKIIKKEMIAYYNLIIIIPTVQALVIMYNMYKLGAISINSITIFISIYFISGTISVLIAWKLYYKVIVKTLERGRR